MTKLSNDPVANIALIKTLSKTCWGDKIYLGQLTAAQAILEGGLERSPPSSLALLHCNLFGMKPGQVIRAGTAKPGYVYLPTNEYVHNVGMVKMQQPFLSNTDIEDSLAQHKELFERLDRYAPLFKAESFEAIAEAVHEAGYATDPSYPQLLISMYKKHNLGAL